MMRILEEPRRVGSTYCQLLIGQRQTYPIVQFEYPIKFEKRAIYAGTNSEPLHH
jgi:hypothetical protein